MIEDSRPEDNSPSQMSPARDQFHSMYIFWAILAAFFFIHLYRLSAPPNGYHKWRESDTAAISLNYYQEDSNFFHPRINQRGATSGITGMELPIYNYSVFLLYLLFGLSHAIPRLITIIGACLCLWLFFKIVASLMSDRVAVWSVLAMAFSPLFFFYSYKIMPDIWMLTFLLGAVYFYLRFNHDRNYPALIVSGVCLCLSGCIKPTALFIYLPFLFLWWSGKKRDRAVIVSLLIYIAVTFAIVWGWIQYASWVNDEYGSGGFYLGENLPNFHHFLFASQFYRKLFMQWPFELWIGWSLVPAFLYGIYRAVKDKSGRIFLVWILGAYLVFAVTAEKSASHDYYTLIIVPSLAVFSGLGLASLHSGAGWRRNIVIILVLAALPVAMARIHSRFGPTEDFAAIRESAEKIIPAGDLVMAQDNSPAVRLYQLNRRGWPLRFGIRCSQVIDYVRQGAKFLVLENPIETYNDSLALIFDNNASRIGPLYCYSLRYKN